MLHPPGGVVGGDELHIDVRLEAGANVLLTTPGATKFYRSTGALAQQVQVLSVADGCTLEWLPQENIFFNQTHSHLCTRILLEEAARFIGWEINCYGRPASKDMFTNGLVRTRLEVVRDGTPLLLDQLLIEDAFALKSPGSFNGYSCFGTLIATPVSPRLLDLVRTLVGARDNRQLVGLSLLDDLLVARCLGHYSESIANTLRSIWAALRPELLEREACHPRIWLT
ncbi:urease accessory protein UreD [Thiolapillus sp.]